MAICNFLGDGEDLMFELQPAIVYSSTDNAQAYLNGRHSLGEAICRSVYACMSTEDMTKLEAEEGQKRILTTISP